MIKNLTPKEIRNQRRTNRSKRNNVAHPTRLRMVVSKSLKHINVQIIDDNEMKTLVSASSLDKDLQSKVKNGNRYHGRVKAIADAAREAGLKF